MIKKKRGDKVMWQERILKKKGKKEWVAMNIRMLYFLHSQYRYKDFDEMILTTP